MKSPAAILVTVMVMMSVGCVSSLPGRQSTPGVFKGFVVAPLPRSAPPPGSEWVACSQKDSHVEYWEYEKEAVGVDAEGGWRTRVRRALVVRRYDTEESYQTQEEFLQYVKSDFLVPSPGYEMVAVDAAIDSRYAPLCARYSFKMKQYGDSMNFRFQEGIGYLCVHPRASNKLFKIECTEVYLPGHEPEISDTVAAVFFDGFAFSDFTK